VTTTSNALTTRDEFREVVRNKIRALGEHYDPEANQVLFTLVRAANLLTTDLDSTVWRPFGVSYAGFRVIFTIWVTGPLEPRTIARLASVSRASISSVINTLERDGYVIRKRESKDRRLVTVDLTEKGRELWHDSFEGHNAREKRWASALDAEEQQTLVDLLQRLIRGRPRGAEDD